MEPIRPSNSEILDEILYYDYDIDSNYGSQSKLIAQSLRNLLCNREVCRGQAEQGQATTREGVKLHVAGILATVLK